VIVDPFNYSAVMTSVQAVFGTNQNIGQGIKSMLVTRMSKAGNIIVVDRATLQQVLQEQDFNKSNRVKQGSGARIGKINGADLILAGDIVIFGRDDKKKGAGVAAVGALCRFCGLASKAIKSDDKAVVAVDYKLIDAETTDVLYTGEARGESKRSGFNMSAFGAAYWRAAGAANVDMTSSNFTETIIGEATQDCVNKLADQLAQQTAGLKRAAREVEATVVDVSQGSLMISAGTPDGVVAGDVFEIFRPDREVKDPTTGEVLDRAVTKIGEMTVTTVRDKVALGSYAGSPAAVKYIARKKMPAVQ
jgi:curli biogenesis system outer membrane secretion channel CsgG